MTSNAESDKIKNIKLEEIQSKTKSANISDDVANMIMQTLDETKSRYLFDGVDVAEIDEKIVMQTNPVKNGTFFDVKLVLNKNFLGGKELSQIDDIFKNTNYTVANSFREAVLHEKYHALLINNLNQAQLESLYDELSHVHIDGISKTAFIDGSECIAEVGVLVERDEYSNIPLQAIELFNKYIGGIR